MTTMHGIARFVFVLLAGGTFAYSAYLVAAADPTPRNAGETATPNHDPHRTTPVAAEAAAVPTDLAAWTPVLLRAEPEAAAPPVLDFVAADSVLYARANARLRAAPSTAADVVAKLSANAPLRAVARSSDGAWSQVSLADGRSGFVHRDAVTSYRLATATVPSATVPAARAASTPAATPRRSMTAHRSQDLLGLVDQAKDWLNDMADRAQSSPPKKVIRATH